MRIGRIATFIALTLFTLFVVLPIVWIFISAFKSSHQIVGSPWTLPDRMHWENFGNAWKEAGIGNYFFNSLVVSTATLVILLPIGAMAAYVLARFTFRGSNLILGGFMGGMMFPQFLPIVPLFFLLNGMGLLDTKTGLTIVYVAFSLPFTVFVLSGFFQGLPGELAEAAMIDGCGDAKTFWKVMLPLAKPGVLVVGIFNLIGLWNEYGLALVLVSSEQNRTLPLGIANLVMVEHYNADWGAMFAGLVIVMTPMIGIYWLFRDKIHETMLAGALKG